MTRKSFAKREVTTEMPMHLMVHLHGCPWRMGECSCNPQQFTEERRDEALSACDGKTDSRLQVTFTPPPTNWRTKPNVPAHRSQQRRHLRPISD